MKRTSLNHQYRLVWSRVKAAFVVTDERAKSQGKARQPTSGSRLAQTVLFPVSFAKKALLGMLVSTALLGANQSAQAQWTDLVIDAGNATSTYTGNHLDVNVTSNRVIGTANSLDIAANESVNVFFTQGGGHGLFRATGNSATSIMGALSSNGNLFLINQNGVLFGQGAQVDVGGLVASTMNITNADFMSGQYQFNTNGHDGSVINHGVIKVADGGYAVLLGSNVENTGSIVANQGSVVLASAEQAELDFYGNGLVKAKLSGDALHAVINQAGNIQADGGTVQLATNSRSSAVNVSGIVQANTLVERDGVIRLEGGDNARVAVSGSLSAKGEQAGATGGTIAVTGEQVALLGDATLDASGDAGGGTVLVGGDYQGKNENVYNARTTYVGSNSQINVDATKTGEGGKAIVWADNITRYYGNIEAKGGQQSGNGGFVEVSGKQQLDFTGGVDVSAQYGQGGTVLLDPEFIVLDNSTQTAPTNNANGTPDIAYADAPAAGTTTIQISDVRGFSELYLQATKDITVANNIYMQTNNSIVFEAGRDINVDAGIRTYGTGSTSLTAANDINVNAEIRAHSTGNIDLTAANNINIGARMYNFGTGYITLSADADVSGAGDVNINQRVFARQGDITISGHNVNNTTTGTIIQTQGLVGQDSGDVYVIANNAVNLAGNIFTTGRNSTAGLDGANAGIVAIVAGGTITTNNISAYGGNGGTGNTAGGAAGTIVVNSTGAGDINTGTLNARNGAARGTGVGGAAGSINITNSDGNINTRNLDAFGNLNGHGGDINVAATNGDVTVTGRVYSYGGGVNNGHTLAGRNGGDITISGANTTITNRVNANGNTAKGSNQAGGDAGTVNISAANALTVRDVYSRTGRATDAGAGGSVGGITLSGSSVTATSTISTSGERNGDAGNINITSSTGDINLANVYASGGGSNTNTTGNNAGNITINSAGALVTTNVYANGSAGNGLNNDGGNAGIIDVDAAGAITMNAVNASGGAGGNATGSNANGGNAGAIDIRSTAAGDININNTLAMHSGFARGAGNGGNAGSIIVKNDDGNIATRNIYAEGYNHGDGSNVTLDAEGAGNVTVTGQIRAHGDVNATGDRAGADGGDVIIKGINTTVTSTINANGYRARGTDQDGGNAGTVAVTGTGDVNLQNVYARNGNATGAGAGGSVGSIDVTGATITAGNFSTAGERNGDGGNINFTSTTGDIAVTGVYVQGGGTNTNTAGNSGGTINVNSAGAFNVTNHLYAQGSSGNGTNNNGGNAGTINVNAAGAISAKRIYAYGGAGGGNNAVTNLAQGGNAGTVTLNSTAASDITLTDAISVRAGYSRGSAPGATAGTVNLTNADGNISTRNIRTDGNNHSNGGDITINAGTTGDVTVDGLIYTFGDVNPTATTFVGTDGGDLNITAANVTVTNTINTNGGRGRGANQIGGNAGDVTINAAGAISTQVISANGGNAGTGAGSNAAGGDAGNINLTSTGAGDITTTNITARTGYTRGSATATGAGSVNIQNDNGAVTTGNITTRGQRRGYGGDITAVTTGGDITVGTVDASASNVAASNGGDVILATTTGDATVPNVLTGGRWLVYSGDPRNDTIGAFKATADFKQYNTNFGDALLDTGNGFVYRFAPTITTSLTGAATKPYDGNTTASIAGLTLNKIGGEIDGDVITISGLTSATYDNAAVGTGKTVTSNPLTAVSGINGTTTVYGYQVNAASGNIGAITSSPLSIAEAQAAAASENPRNTAGLGELIDASNQPQQFVSVFDVNATAAGGDIDPESTCQPKEDKSSLNPNTSLMLNFGITLPEGVEEYCI